MQKEEAYRWADALDSGKYPQSRGQLYREKPGYYGKSGYCCLGVKCEITPGLGVSWRTVVYPPFNALPVLDLKTRNGEIPSLLDRFDRIQSLADLNDDGFTFPQIADIIRHFYEEL